MKQILLTNDDGIHSHGLWAAAQALSELGYVHVVAPREQFSAAGRSLPLNSDGKIEAHQVTVNSKPWTVYAVGGSPAQAVLHAVLEILPKRPDLLVAGINYGENIGSGVTISGTIGAALEGASLGIPALAVSLETTPEQHYSLSEDVDFSTASYFTTYFGRRLLSRRFPADVQVIKVDVPCDATPQTPWVLTRLSRERYFEALPPERSSWDSPGKVGYCLAGDERWLPGSDAYALRVQRMVSVTPLSLDLTSRVEFSQLEQLLSGS